MSRDVDTHSLRVTDCPSYHDIAIMAQRLYYGDAPPPVRVSEGEELEEALVLSDE